MKNKDNTAQLLKYKIGLDCRTQWENKEDRNIEIILKKYFDNIEAFLDDRIWFGNIYNRIFVIKFKHFYPVLFPRVNDLYEIGIHENLTFENEEVFNAFNKIKRIVVNHNRIDIIKQLRG